MNAASISISYFFLIVSIISLGFFLYFKLILLKTNDNSKSRKKIVGTMKDVEGWEKKNNTMSYISLFWCILSMGIFVFLKFFYKATLLSLMYVYIYISLIVLSNFIIYFKDGKKVTKEK